jgi:hypothetical protein
MSDNEPTSDNELMIDTLLQYDWPSEVKAVLEEIKAELDQIDDPRERKIREETLCEELLSSARISRAASASILSIIQAEAEKTIENLLSIMPKIEAHMEAKYGIKPPASSRAINDQETLGEVSNYQPEVDRTSVHARGHVDLTNSETAKALCEKLDQVKANYGSTLFTSYSRPASPDTDDNHESYTHSVRPN